MAITIKRQSDKVSTTGQIALADIQSIGQAGFKTVVCNRPDEEAG